MTDSGSGVPDTDDEGVVAGGSESDFAVFRLIAEKSRIDKIILESERAAVGWGRCWLLSGSSFGCRWLGRDDMQFEQLDEISFIVKIVGEIDTRKGFVGRAEDGVTRQSQ